MTGQGGWPLNVFLTPEQVPFFAGTYFPPGPRMGMPSWRTVLDAVARGLGRAPRRDPRAAASGSAERLRGGAAAASRPSSRSTPGALDDGGRGAARASSTARTAASAARRSSRPRRRSSSCCAAARPEMTRAHAARDGLGRHVRPGRRRLRALLGRRPTGSSPTSRRCSTTTRCWRAPTCTAGRSPASRCSGASCEETLDWALREMRGPRAASTPRSTPTPRARRASSTSGPPRSCARRSGEPDADEAIAWFGATDRGNFEGRNIPVRGPGEPERRDAVAPAPATRCARERVWPGLDDKRLTSWNALMISALADAGRGARARRLPRRRSRGARTSCCASCATTRAGCCAPGRTARAS